MEREIKEIRHEEKEAKRTADKVEKRISESTQGFVEEAIDTHGLFNEQPLIEQVHKPKPKRIEDMMAEMEGQSEKSVDSRLHGNDEAVDTSANEDAEVDAILAAAGAKRK